MERRTFIIAAVAGGVGLAEYVYFSGWMNGLSAAADVPDVKDYEGLGAHAALEAITANGDFYITSKGSTPAVDASTWKLTIDGLVEQPFSLSYGELLALPAVDRVLTLECIGNSIGGNQIGNARWTGAALKPLLERARPAPEATHVAIYGADGLSTGHPLERAWREENFIAYRMNGAELPRAHGYPARLFIPGKFGMKQPKWLTRLELLNHHYTGYWERWRWSDECERWAHARFTGLRDGTTITRVNGRPIELAGYAVGNLDSIRAVEISFDDGAGWRAAEIFSNPSPLTWAFWKYAWRDAQPGTYRIRLRATDGQGRVEGYGPRHSFPGGATGQQRLTIHID
jgi:DMSO/TMAO reductase YedYZ molybdopterin-dependent catalytic subunit